jgi:cytochrome c oxidase subunit II
LGRFWSLLFLMVPVLGTLCYMAGMLSISGPLAIWFPENVNSMAVEVDRLHDIILALIGIVFIVTGVVLFYFIWKYDASTNTMPAKFVHGNHRLEFWWTMIPSVIFVGLAAYQLKVWADVKIYRPMLAGADGQLGTEDDKPLPPHFEVVGRQFEWRIRYAGPDHLLDTIDDIIGEVNELHVPVGQPMVGSLKAADVLHSFFIPALRIKNDVIPGTRQVVWFNATKEGKYEIVCTELCGWGHYKMKGRFVVQSQADYDAYLAKLKQDQFQRQYSPDEEEAAGLARQNESASRVNSTKTPAPALKGEAS